MLKNYLVTILRQVQKNKVFSFINIFGLALGMAACLVIAQYVNFHTSFDTYHAKSDRIFRIENEFFQKGESLGYSSKIFGPMTDALLEQSPDIESLARFYDYNYANNSIIYTRGDEKVNFEQNDVFITGAETFEVFDFQFVAGSPEKFTEPQKAILTLEASRKYFSDPQKAIGSTFTLSGNNGAQEYELVGVLEDLPDNSHIQFELLLSYPSLDNYTKARTNWTYASMVTYVALKPQGNMANVMGEIERLHKENAEERLKASGYTVNFFYTPLKEIHLRADIPSVFVEGVDGTTLLILGGIAIIILIIAWINYMNLSLVRTMERLKEMGIRKCMGSSMKQLTGLFVLEAFVMNILALGLAIILTQAGEKYLIEVTGLPVTALMDLQVVGLLALLIIAGTILIGLYPYALLKTIKIVNVLVGQRGKVGGQKMRKSLVFIQFMITFILIAGTLTVYNQINYMREADLGIDIENVLVIQSPPGDVGESNRQDVSRFNTLKTELLKHTSITEITNAGEIPGEPVGWGASLYLKNQSKEASVPVGLISMDVDFPKFFGIDIVAGRALKPGDDPWSKGDVVINEKLADKLGFSNPEDAIGAELDGFYGPTLKVIGVAENHHHTSLHDDYAPLAYILSSWTEYYFVKMKLDDADERSRGEQLTNTLNIVKEEWGNVFTDYQMNYFFLDRAFDEQYKEDVRFGKIFTGFASIAILIACMGLFGLTSFMVQQRTKEIGIRKVLGANSRTLMAMLSKDYLGLILAAGVISMPLAWYMMNSWLQDYTFRIDLGWWFYIIPILFVLSMAFLSIVSKISRTIRKNPVESLRYE
ncbi:MAG: ABC transporter permease [Ekhidna sp.]